MATPPEGLGDRYRRSGDALWRCLPDRVVMLPPAGGGVVTLDDSGPALWAALLEPRSLDELACHLAEHFATAPDLVRADIAPILGDLVTRGLVDGPSAT